MSVYEYKDLMKLFNAKIEVLIKEMANKDSSNELKNFLKLEENFIRMYVNDGTSK